MSSWVMPSVCAAAMALGLCIDTLQVHPEALAALCANADSLAASWAVHRRAMPATLLLMLLAPALLLMTMAHAPRRMAVEAIGQLVMWPAMLCWVPISTVWAARAGVSGFGAMVAAMLMAMLMAMLFAMLLAKLSARLLEQARAGAATRTGHLATASARPAPSRRLRHIA